MQAQDVYQRAADLVGGDRARRHGGVLPVHTRTAEFWSAYLNHPIAAHDVALMMLLLKVARTSGGTFNPDDYIDAAGYAGIAAELASNA
jgi:hypothetical protein